MARPTKQGIDYFPLDVHLDDKFKFIEIQYGLEGFGVIVKILQRIYANCYWCKWGNDERIIFAHENRVEVSILNEIVGVALKRGVFNMNLYNRYGILTSKGIQKRYQTAVYRRKDVEVIDEYLLIDGTFGVNVSNNSVNVSKRVVESEPSDSQSTHKIVKDKIVKDKETPSDVDIVFESYKKKLSLLPQPRLMTNKRKTHISARVDEFGIETVLEVIDKVAQSDFLMGKVKDFKADFDWIFNPNNFVKILEGKYGGRENAKGGAEIQISDNLGKRRDDM